MSKVLITPLSNYSESEILTDFIHSSMQLDDRLSDFFEKSTPSSLVVIKPNWIQESHDKYKEQWEQVITHPEIVLSVIEVLARKLNGTGTICICDAPHSYANFSEILSRGNLEDKLDRYYQNRLNERPALFESLDALKAHRMHLKDDGIKDLLKIVEEIKDQ